MGLTSTLFYNPSDSEAETLYKRVSPSQEHFDEQTQRWNDLKDYLKTELSNLTNYNVSSWLQGSYKFGTQIRPTSKGDEYDIDLGIYFEWQGEPEDGDYSPAQLKSFVQNCLKNYMTANSDDVIEVLEPSKPRCCRIRFKGSFHIDVPCYHLDTTSDSRMLCTNDDEWETSDPKELYVWFKKTVDNDNIRGKARRLIQYIKCWAGLTFPDIEDRPSSVLITVLVAQEISKLSSEQIRSEDEALYNLLVKIVDRLTTENEIKNPVNTDEALDSRLSSDQRLNVVQKFEEFLQIATTAISLNSKIEAALKWCEAFGHFFFVPEQDVVTESASGSVIPFRVNPNIKVSAVSKTNPNHNWQGYNSIGPIPTDCTIDFQVTNTEAIPVNATIQWFVRNIGNEAEYVNDLGHFAGFGLSVSRNSAYNGTHCMDCIIKHNNRIIGFTRVPVIIQGVAIARRNPLRRPNYTSFRR